MNPPKMPIHIGDYKRDTGHLRAAGHGAYLLLMFHYWSTGSLPDDDDQLSAIACMTKAEWRKHRPMLAKFFKEEWKHTRIDDDLAAAKASYERRATAGQRGGNAKSGGKQSSSIATALPEQPLTLNLEEEREDTAAAVTTIPVGYAFESGVIRLKQKDFDQWKQSFSYLDLRAELLALTQWAELPTQRDKWFFAVAGALAKRNREVKISSEKEKQKPFKWNGQEGCS